MEKINKEEKNELKNRYVFDKSNYKLLLIGLALIFLGFLLMTGGNVDNIHEFSYDIFNTRRLTIAPILVIAGFVVQIFAIMKKPKE